ncbi:hypothetical protein [Dehalogenimonas etheniformans]|uniref:Uncharacterized protein n=1 Tax=Dehalogenimonas etheniformans TaxID=1536648 RepID=A0A2P5PA59_9CHLR|nr:hypothetical protein [Dehalogenimonas etheniformans]PPD59196.1 hypothetical protein JP09_000525 [Dehalogenimonas etheniformans]QNT75761.1 hypothetical protein HX448_03195 [Dehalogenimonas etheniformans]
MNLAKRFSIPHRDNWPSPSLYYEAINSSTHQFKEEIYDIYFGAKFRYNYREKEAWDNYPKPHEVLYGNVMGVEATNEQIDNLFRIQKDFGIEISLTINQLNVPIELYYSKNDRVLEAFINWLQEFYDRGLRSCTLANNHLMRSGVLHKRFPEMKWKNTVNQQVSTAQQVLDYLYLGYNVVQLDRSLNRNMDELKRIREAVDEYKERYPEKHVKTCMLVWEDCMPSCPFKREHDDLQMHLRKINYELNPWSQLTCKTWRDVLGDNTIPRFGTNCYWSSVDTFNEYAELVDIFKYSGRLSPIIPQGNGTLKAGWLFSNRVAADSFSTIIENKFEPLYLWIFGTGIFSQLVTDPEIIQSGLSNNFWMTDQGKKLERVLMNCKNQCHRCHLCEKTFGIDDIQSILEPEIPAKLIGKKH